MRPATAPGVFAAVAVGAAAGGMVRYLLGTLAGPEAAFWPWPTLAANALGSLMIGLLFGAERFSLRLGVARRLGLMTGFCGGLTTFSIFSLETVLLMNQARVAAAAGYVAASVAVWLSMVAAGFALGRLLERRAGTA